MAQLKNTTISDTGFLQLPVGTTAQRPSPAAGQMRFNTNAGKAEFYNSAEAAWVSTLNRGVIATGGTVYDTDVEGTTFRVHVFINTGNSAFTVTKAGPVEYLMAAGGGAGGGYHGGGGGAGGLITGTTTVTAQTYTITVGTGGTAATSASNTGNPGDNSVFNSLTAIGGGAGISQSNEAQARNNGGSGGGGCDGASSVNHPGGSGTSGQGNKGGDVLGSGPELAVFYGTAGGGGAGGAGVNGGIINGGFGGIGILSNLTGLNTFYAGGGGGTHLGSAGITNYGIGGIGGGGTGGISPTPHNVAVRNSSSGVTGTGGGGGGFLHNNLGGGAGGSGIVVIRYPLRQENPVSAAGKTIGDGLVLDLDFAKPTVYAGTGTVVTDSRLNGIQGTVFNSSSKATRTHRASFTFNGSSSYIDTNDKLIKTTGGWTVSSWVTTGATVNLHNFIGSTSYTYNSWFWTILSGRLALWNISPGAWYYGSTTLLPNTTYQAVLVSNSNGTSYQFYLNGVAEGGDHVSYSWNPSYAGLIIGFIGRGMAADGRYWLGEYYSLQVWDRVLTAAEVAQQYNATRWRFGV